MSALQQQEQGEEGDKEEEEEKEDKEEEEEGGKEGNACKKLQISLHLASLTLLLLLARFLKLSKSTTLVLYLSPSSSTVGEKYFQNKSTLTTFE